MASGSIKSITFTPDTTGEVAVTCRYEGQGVSGGDWGSAYLAKPYLTQNAVTTYGDGAPLSTSRLPGMVEHVFTVTEGLSVTFGLYGEISGAVTAHFWNISVIGKYRKR